MPHNIYESLIFFFLRTGEILPIAHTSYIDLVRDLCPLPDYANQRLRVADWYVDLSNESAVKLANETYSFLSIDGNGYIDWTATNQKGLACEGWNAAPGWQATGKKQVDRIGHRDQSLLRCEATWLPDPSERAELDDLVSRRVAGTSL